MPKQQQLHIGHLIKSIFDESGMTVAEFARRIHCARPNVYSIFERYDIGVEQLIRISMALNHNFFEDIMMFCGLKSSLFPKQMNLSIYFDKLSNEEKDGLSKLFESLPKDRL